MSDNIGKPSSEAVQQVLRWLLDRSRERRRPVANQNDAKPVRYVAELSD